MIIKTRGKAPIFPTLNIKTKIDKIGEEFFGPSSSIFVGRFGYPNVFIGPLASIEYSKEQDDPSKWFGKSYQEIVDFRSLLLRSKHKQNIKDRTRFVAETQELSLSAKPVDVELTFEKKPIYRITFSNIVQPMGPSVSLKEMRLTENPNIAAKTEKIIGDELRASDASYLLYKHGMDVYKLTNILSSGVLGLDRKLVPTRWSVTAVDDVIAKKLINNIRNYKAINEFLVFSSDYMDNHFTILLMPGYWQFENFEAWAPGSNWCFSSAVEVSEEYEPYQGRSDYAEKQVGGYYASRIAVCEFLEALRRQATVIVFREIGENYSIPLGVWQVRENVRNAFKQEPRKFESKEEAMNYLKTRLKLPLMEYTKRGRILQQKKLIDF